MSDLVAFLRARLDEDEAAAKARRGIFPSPAVLDNGAVALHIQYGGNAVITHYRHPVEGYGDMAALRAWADTESGWTDVRVLREIQAKRAILGQLSSDLSYRPPVPVGHRRAWAIATLIVEAMAGAYSDHPDYDRAWATEGATR